MVKDTLSLSSVPDSSSSVLRQRWFLVGLGIFFLAVTVNYFLKASGDATAKTLCLNAGPRSQILEVDQGENIWAKHNQLSKPARHGS